MPCCSMTFTRPSHHSVKQAKLTFYVSHIASIVAVISTIRRVTGMILHCPPLGSCFFTKVVASSRKLLVKEVGDGVVQTNWA